MVRMGRRPVQRQWAASNDLFLQLRAPMPCWRAHARLAHDKCSTAPPLSPIHTTTRRSLPSSPAWVSARYSSVCGQVPLAATQMWGEWQVWLGSETDGCLGKRHADEKRCRAFVRG